MEQVVADVELRSLSTTGGHQVWPAATHLLEYLSSHQSDAHCFVELGAGTGFLGLSLAMRRRGIHVVLSEQDLEEAQALLRDNLVKNHVKNAVVKVGDFFDLTRLPVIGQTDVLIIGSDLVYTREIAVAFPKFVCALIKANPGSSMLYCHTFRRYDFVDSLLLKQIAEEGLSVVEVCADDSERAVEAIDCESGEFEDFDLFPEKVMRILKIHSRSIAANSS